MAKNITHGVVSRIKRYPGQLRPAKDPTATNERNGFHGIEFVGTKQQAADYIKSMRKFERDQFKTQPDTKGKKWSYFAHTRYNTVKLNKKEIKVFSKYAKN